MLIILCRGDKIKTCDSYDDYVCSELLSRRSRVTQHMMHGPCGEMNSSCACMKETNGKHVCRFHFPKSFSPLTIAVNDSYSIYHRRDNGDYVKRKYLDNRWVTPNNPYLLIEFDCHINVEICSTVKVVKYIYKYVYKGHDRICFDIEKKSLANQR
ncbi:LOW QUALITY PROTEIN: hypothetical protein V2J09_018007 [Rumex salicifolius]